MRTVTGDPATDALVPAAAQLSAAVHEHDGERIAELLDDADLRGLVVTLAAMVPDDRAPSELLAWLAHPYHYRRLRAAGVPTLDACAVIVRSADADTDTRGRDAT